MRGHGASCGAYSLFGPLRRCILHIIILLLFSSLSLAPLGAPQNPRTQSRKEESERKGKERKGKTEKERKDWIETASRWVLRVARWKDRKIRNSLGLMGRRGESRATNRDLELERILVVGYLSRSAGVRLSRRRWGQAAIGFLPLLVPIRPGSRDTRRDILSDHLRSSSPIISGYLIISDYRCCHYPIRLKVATLPYCS